jgi:cobalt-zinc-cadmium efflux system protein
MSNMHTHPHTHSHANHALIIALTIATIFAAIEGLAGWWSQSLALLSDSGHMASDVLALALAAVAAWIARKPPSDQHTYGLGRAEVLGAWISSLLVLIVAIIIIITAINRIHQPPSVSGGIVMVVASIGVIVNLIIGWILSHGEQTLNIRAAILHVIGDLLGSVAALVAGAVIYFTGWALIDPILSIFISILIIISSFTLLRESLLVLMEAVPIHLDATEIGQSMARVSKVRSVHDLHIWTLSSGVVVLTAHIEIDDFKLWSEVLGSLKELLAKQFGIDHITLQPETNVYTLYPIIHKPSPT